MFSWVSGNQIESLAKYSDFIEKYFCQKCYSFWFTLIINIFLTTLFNAAIIASTVAFITHILTKHNII